MRRVEVREMRGESHQQDRQEERGGAGDTRTWKVLGGEAEE